MTQHLFGFSIGIITAGLLSSTVNGEAMAPNAVTAEMVAQEKQMATLLLEAKEAVVVTPKLTDALAKSFAELAARKINIQIAVGPNGVSAASIDLLKKNGAKIGVAPSKFNESAVAATGFVATGGILEGKRGARIIKDRQVAAEMIGSFKALLKYVTWK